MLMIVLLSFVMPLCYFAAMDGGTRNRKDSVVTMEATSGSAGEAVLRIGDHVYLKLYSKKN